MDDKQKAQKLKREIHKSINDTKKTQSIIDKIHDKLDKYNKQKDSEK